MIGRVERFYEDVLSLFERIGARDFIAGKPGLERRNASTPQAIGLTSRQRLYLEELFSADYEAFGYSRRSQETLPRNTARSLTENGAVSAPPWQ